MKIKEFYLLIFFGILVTVLFLFANPSLKQKEFVQTLPTYKESSFIKQDAVVEKVIDGDTIKVLINSKEDAVRLIGIDAPETVDPEKPAQCFGKEASEKAKEILTGKTIILESDPTQGDRDEYDRLLRYVFLQDGTNFNKFMISEGYAYEYTFKGNPYKCQSEFKNVEKKSQENKKGLWADGICNY
jgi:micrococcal nuclease